MQPPMWERSVSVTPLNHPRETGLSVSHTVNHPCETGLSHNHPCQTGLSRKNHPCETGLSHTHWTVHDSQAHKSLSCPIHKVARILHWSWRCHACRKLCSSIERQTTKFNMLCMKWRGMVCGCMVDTECAEMAAVSHGTSHVTTEQPCKYTTLVDTQNALQKSTVTHLESPLTRATKVQWVCSRVENSK